MTMRINWLIISVFFIYLVVPVEPEKYDVILIPVQVKQNMLNRLVDRIDMEQYDEATELANIDSFEINDYSKPNGNDRVLSQGYDVYGGDKIVGGQEVEINLYPYHVAYGTNCGGAIIGDKWVLTAGHCGYKSHITAGSKIISSGKKVKVKNNFIHPGWTAKNKEHPFDNDFQVLELAEPLNFDDNTAPIRVAHIEDMVVGTVVTVTGWGNTEENGQHSNILRAVRVPIISKENCQKVPFPYFNGRLTPNMFCAGFPDQKMDACQGDSGGPATANNRLLGMVSFGYGCATPGAYGVYSKVFKVRPWIKEITGLPLY